MALGKRLLQLLVLLVFSQLISASVSQAQEKCIGGMTYTTNEQHPTPDCICPLGKTYFMNIKGDTQTIGGCVSDPIPESEDVPVGSGGFWVASGLGNGKIYYSSDGLTWTEGSGFSPSHEVYEIIHNGQQGDNSEWFATGAAGSSNSITVAYLSSDGINWTAMPSVANLSCDGSGYWCDSVYGGGLITVVGGNGDSGPSYIYYTDDSGTTWQQGFYAGTGKIHSVAFSDDDFYWIAVGERSRAWRSVDGRNWTQDSTFGGGFVRGEDIIYADGMWAIAATSYKVYTSTDNGDTWIERNTPATVGDFEMIAHNGLTGADSQWVIVGGVPSSRSIFMYSSDGINWNLSPSDFGNKVFTVAHNGLTGINGRWVATGFNPDNPADPICESYISYDGITWTRANANTGPEELSWWSLASDKLQPKYEGDLWIASAGAGEIKYSKDGGTTWKNGVLPDSPWGPMTVGAISHNGKTGDDSMWTAVAHNGFAWESQAAIYTSDNGIVWEYQTHTLTLGWSSFGGGRNPALFTNSGDIYFGIGAHVNSPPDRALIFKSTDDGETWVKDHPDVWGTFGTGSTNPVYDMAYRPAMNRLMGVTSGGILRQNGGAWEEIQVIDGVNSSWDNRAITHGAAITTTWVVAGAGGMFTTYNDGLTWTLDIPNTEGIITDIEYAAGTSPWVAVTDNGKIYNSSSGLAFTYVTTIPDMSFTRVSHNGKATGGLYFASGYQISTGDDKLYKSTDGVIWTDTGISDIGRYAIEHNRPLH